MFESYGDNLNFTAIEKQQEYLMQELGLHGNFHRAVWSSRTNTVLLSVKGLPGSRTIVPLW